ncbi:MAG: radical SAM protein [Candidatus Methanomethylophilaceae archaeon]
MPGDIKVLIIDGYIDDPAALGVPPYISPIVRAIAGAAMDAGAEVTYLTVDSVRGGCDIPDADVSVVMSGNTVPGKYIRSMPMSVKELERLFPRLKGWRMIGGSAADTKIAESFDFVIRKDLAASLYDGMCGKEVLERYRTLDEWNRWMLLGSRIVTQHPDFPFPLIAEIETFRGCHRYRSGGCSYCIEPLKGRPLMRSPEDVLEEARALRELGVRNIRVGGQTCIVSFGSTDTHDPPRPDPEAVERLFRGLGDMGFDTVHVDNANPAVISQYPEESRRILKCISECCTPGNVLALGMESADIDVIRANNLNSTPEQVLDAIRMINGIGSERGENGMPRLLPGLNLIAGLDGETGRTYSMNREFLDSLLDEGLLVRRINIRQVLPIRREFKVRVNPNAFKRYKEEIRENIDHVMLERMVPKGTVLKDVFMEIHDGNTTFGRQIGSYPLLVGIPYRLELGKCYDIVITDWGMRSVTGIEDMIDINHLPMTSLAGLPGIGKKRASKIVMARPFTDMGQLEKVIDDPHVFSFLKEHVDIADRIN